MAPRAMTTTPQTVRMRPVAELSQRPRGKIFSSPTRREIAAIQRMFMTPSDEEQAHQSPAAAGAKEPVFEAHPEGAARAFPPAGHDEFEGSAALGEAGVFERGELKDAGGDEQDAAEPGAAAGHGGGEKRFAVENPLRERGKRD